ncbi:concanavalin A-like lectin/glucanase domain-containing protein [Mycena rosella]|uniref:Concanavalin A-like lectin/glucanase domain-containing protein n=1 Tax=Mycena rosella TaxID=1033263 RepID=A0AAD7DHV2_MYCRO|nr:concanavalin A-like lectin/glucanase domain-containing protein [Mycena rosella]
MAQPVNPFADPTLDAAAPRPLDAPRPTAKRMPSTALPPAAPYAAVAKPWTAKPNPRARISYYLTYAIVFIGAGLGALQSVLTYRGVRLDRQPLCLVFHDDFNSGDDAGVFGTATTPGRFLREAQTGGYGNGQFEMTTASSNNSFLLDGNLYLLPTLTPGFPFPDGTTYNETACTWNLTAADGGNKPDGTFDWDGYFAACSRTTNSTAGTIINPVQSARVSTLVSAGGNASALAQGSIRYGRVEVRAKMPVGDWLWPAIWMLPVSPKYGPWPASGEIDLVESRGNGLRYTANGANYVQGSLNWGPTPALNGVGHSYSWWTERRKLFSSGFHTYVLEWTSEWIRIYVDTRLHTLLDLKFNEPFFKRGEFPQTIVGPDGHPAALQDPWLNGTNATPFDQDFYLIMNVAVGGTNGWFPDGQGDKPWLNNAGNPPVDFIKGSNQWLPTWPEKVEDRAMVVDYVKMWKHCGDP